MQTLLNKALNSGSNSTNISVAILILRIAGGAFMLTHGLGKFEALFSGEPI